MVPCASEAELGREYGVSRVTVRRALELLRDEGLVTARQGVGWFVAVDPVRQSLGRVTTVEAALEAAGAASGRRVLEFTFEPALPDVAKTLDLPADGEVLRVTRLNLADGEPFAVVTVWVAAALGAQLSRADVERSTFYDLLPLQGVEPGRVVQTITAVAADPPTARAARRPRRLAALGLPEGHLRSPRTRGPRCRAPLRGPPHRARSRIPRYADPRRPPWLRPSNRSRPSRSCRRRTPATPSAWR